MSVIRAENPWGTQGGLEPQRTDLWVVNLGQVYDAVFGHGNFGPIGRQSNIALDSELNEYTAIINPLNGDKKSAKFYCSSIKLPDQTVTPEIVKRDSMPYNVPGYDQPLGQIGMTFIHDISNVQRDDVRRSEIYALLALWRTLVRAGRGEVAGEFALALDKDYRVNYGFDIPITFLGGVDINSIVEEDEIDSNGGLEITAIYTLVNCWLSSIQVGPELNYESSRFMQIQCQLYADDITQKRSGS